MNDILFIPNCSTQLAAGSTARPSSDIINTLVHSDLSSPPVFLNHNTPADNSSQLRIGDISVTSVNPTSVSGSLNVGHSSQPSLSPPELPKSAPLAKSELRSSPPTDTQLLPEEGMPAAPGLTRLERAEAMVQYAEECKAPIAVIHRWKDKVRHERMANKKLALRTRLEANLSQQEIAEIRTQSEQCAPPDRKEKYDILMKYFKDHPDEPLTKKYPLDFLCSSVINKEKNDLEGVERKQLTVFKKKLCVHFPMLSVEGLIKGTSAFLKELMGFQSNSDRDYQHGHQPRKLSFRSHNFKD